MTITRKDTIILAVLLNLVVLAGVFVTARQIFPGRNQKSSSHAFEQGEKHQEGDESASQEEIVALDEIDQLLEEYDAKKKEVQTDKKKDIPRKASPSKDGFYIVRPGDNPWKIAKKFHISFEKLLELNHLDETKAKNLKVGQTLRIVDVHDAKEQ